MADVRALLRVSVAAAVIWLAASGAAGPVRTPAASSGAREPIAAAGLLPGRVSEGIPYASGVVLDVHRPPVVGEAAATAPVVVLIHGCCGNRSDLGGFAEALAAAGALVLNADWAGIDADARFPAAFEDVACAIRFARARAVDLGGDPARVVVVGWSDGALPATVVAAAGETFDGRRCRHPGTSAVPDAVVGLAGFYGWTLPVPESYVSPRAERFFGGSPRTAPTAWLRATPYSWITTGAPVQTLLLVGATDPLRHDARRYATALRQGGREVRLVEIPYAGDQTLISPRSREGRTTISEIISLGGRRSPSFCDRVPELTPFCGPAPASR